MLQIWGGGTAEPGREEPPTAPHSCFLTSTAGHRHGNREEERVRASPGWSSSGLVEPVHPGRKCCGASWDWVPSWTGPTLFEVQSLVRSSIWHFLFCFCFDCSASSLLLSPFMCSVAVNPGCPPPPPGPGASLWSEGDCGGLVFISSQSSGLQQQ